MKNSNIRKIFFSILVILLLAIIYFIVQLNINATNSSLLLQKAYNLKVLNQNVDIILSRKMDYYNYDKTDKVLSEIDNIMKEFKKNKFMNEFLSTNNADINHQEIFSQLEKILKKRRELVNRFNSINSILNNSLRYITTLFVENKDKLQDFVEIHSIVMQMSLGIDTDMEDIQSKLNLLKKHTKSDKDPLISLYLSHINIIIQSYKTLNNIEKENKALQYEKTFSLFMTHLNESVDNMSHKLNDLMIFLSVVLVLMFIAIVSLFDKKIIQEILLRKFKQAVEQSDNLVIITNLEHKIEYVNEAFLKRTGYQYEDVIGKTPSILQSGYHSKEFYKNLSQTISRGEKWSGEFINKDSQNNLQYEKATITPVYNEDGKIINFLAIKLDITAEKEYQKDIENKNIEIEKRYYTDSLTKLGNRNLLMKMLAQKEEGRLFYIDIDNFTQIKTFFGLENSDLLLQNVAYELKLFTNTIQSDSHLFRIKLDEYSLWIKNYNENLELFIKRLQTTLEMKQFMVNNMPITIKVTIGVSESKERANQNRYIESEIAHHDAKSKQIKYQVYTQNNSIERNYKNNFSVANMIQKALDTNNIVVYFQPIYEVKSMKISMYEVLVRLIDGDGSVLTPCYFLDIAKQSSYYHEIMRVVIEKTFEKLEENPDLKLSINFSMLDFNHQPTLEIFFHKLKGIQNPHNISVEILETENVDNFKHVEKIIKKIKGFGCKIGIDDFGSGHSNYYRLSSLDIDYIKIDGSIIQSIDTDNYSLAVLETIMTFCKKMNYPVVAEFVHKKEILDIISSYKIDYAQGFYLSEPKGDTQ